MARCALCNQIIEEGKEHIFNKKKYDYACYTQIQEKNELLKYICQLYGYIKPGPVIYKQLKEFTEIKGYTYYGIQKSLYYFYEIKKNNIKKAVGIGIVPYIYEEAKEYFSQQENAIRKAIAPVEQTYIEVSIEKEQNSRNSFLQSKEINMLDLEELNE